MIKITWKNICWKRKKVWIAAGLVIFLAAGGVAGRLFLLPNQGSGSSALAEQTMEGTVQKGDLELTVNGEGTTVAGTDYQLYNLSMTTEAASIPLEVEEVFVASGDTVSKGDRILRITDESLQSMKEVLANSKATAKAEATSAKLAYQEGILETEAEYQTSLSLYSTAILDYKEEISGYSSALQSARKKLTQAEHVIATYPSKISQEKSTIATSETSLAEAEKKLVSLQKKQETKKAAWETAQSAYESAKDNYSKIAVVYDYLTEYAETNQESGVASLLKKATAEYTAALTAMNQAKASYDTAQTAYEQATTKVETWQQKKTSLNDTITETTEKLETNQSELKEAKSNLNSYQSAYHRALASQTTGTVTAERTYEEEMNTYANAKNVYDTTVASLEQDLQEAEEKLTQAKEQQDAFLAMLSDGFLYASQDGTVSAINYEAGDLLSDLLSIVEYANPNTLSVSVSVDQSEISNVHVGDTANVSVQGTNQRGGLSAAVSAIELASSSDSVSKVTYSVTVSIDNSEGNLSSGKTAAVSFPKETLSGVLMVPANAVIESASGTSKVLRKKTDGTTEQVTVTTGESNGTMIEIKDGLEEGETYVVENKNEEKK